MTARNVMQLNKMNLCIITGNELKSSKMYCVEKEHISMTSVTRDLKSRKNVKINFNLLTS